jgi:hypothetical protein
MPVAEARTMIGVQRHTASVHALSMPAAWVKARDDGDPFGMFKELSEAIGQAQSSNAEAIAAAPPRARKATTTTTTTTKGPRK